VKKRTSIQSGKSYVHLAEGTELQTQRKPKRVTKEERAPCHVAHEVRLESVKVVANKGTTDVVDQVGDAAVPENASDLRRKARGGRRERSLNEAVLVRLPALVVVHDEPVVALRILLPVLDLVVDLELEASFGILRRNGAEVSVVVPLGGDEEDDIGIVLALVLHDQRIVVRALLREGLLPLEGDALAAIVACVEGGDEEDIAISRRPFICT